jgi:LysR family transcriptional regulator, glycine cleavage system transcriptional activator
MHPMSAVQLVTTSRVVDFTREEVDVVIRAGKGKWPGLLSYKLIDVRYTLMVSPALAQQVGGLNTPEDMFKIDLLDPHDDWWVDWFKACGQPHEKLNMDLAPIGLQTITASAAMARRGGALLVKEFFEQEIRDGRLYQPFDITVDTESGYWLAFPEGRRNVPKIKAFRDWILTEIRGSPA